MSSEAAPYGSQSIMIGSVGFLGLETWAGIVALVVALLGAAIVLLLLWRYRRGLWIDRAWPTRAMIAASGLVIAFITVTVVGFAAAFVAAELRLLEPEREHLEQVTRIEIPDGATYEAWHDDVWLDGTYWLTLSVPASELPGLLRQLPRMRSQPPSRLRRELREMHPQWSDAAPSKGLAGGTESPAFQVVVDQSDPDVAVIYVVASTS